MGATVRFMSCVVLSTVFVLAGLVPARAGEPTETIRVAINKGIQVLNDPALKAEDKKEERIEQLRQVVNPIFDFVEIEEGTKWCCDIEQLRAYQVLEDAI